MHLEMNGRLKKEKGAEEQHARKMRKRFSSVFEVGSSGEDMF